MSRLADYFAVIGVPKASSTVSDKQELSGKVLQRFPTKDRDDAGFPEGIEMFCQPSGWEVSYYKKPVTFFVAVLTDMAGRRSYAACLSFFEPFTLVKKHADFDSDESPNDGSSVKINIESSNDSQDNKKDMTMDAFLPKCLCLVSRYPYFDILKGCLTSIYISWIDGNNSLLEKIIGSILGFVHVPPVGAPSVTFSIGIGDKKTLSPPHWEHVPVTGKSVASLFRQLGMHNILSLFCALVTENKVLLTSSSYSLLTSASLGLLALLFPLKFSYVYIPILPSALLDFVNAPTPFVMGVHTTYKDNLPEVNDVITVDLDGGYVHIPESVNLCSIPEPYLSRTRHALTLVLHPSLVVSDLAFPPHVNSSPTKLLDKEIRAIFMRLFAQILSGYRSCLKVIRVHPKPVITFHKGTFMEKRGVFGDDFFNKVLDSISFNTLITERGPPHRTCDLFDELVANIDETLQSELGLDAEIMSNIQEISKKLYSNEFCEDTDNNLPTLPPNLKDQDSLNFPILDSSIIQKHLEDDLAPDASALSTPPPSLDKVSYGTGVFSGQTRHYINIRKLEVLHDCVAYIFENKISEARKALPSVQRALKSRGAQLALCHELASHSEQHRAVLEHDQFNLVVSLMNCALQDDASLNDGAVASALLPLTSEFCMNLAPGVMQFAYTCVQDHPIWQNSQFWEETFYSDVQREIKKLYKNVTKKERQSFDKLVLHNNGLFERLTGPRTSRSSMNNLPTNQLAPPRHDLVIITQSGGYKHDDDDTDVGITNEALDIAATQLGKWSSYPQDDQNMMVTNEESVVYSQAIHFVNRMVYLMIPLNVSDLVKPKRRPIDTVLENVARDGADGSLANTSIGSDNRSNVVKSGGHSTNGSIVDTVDGGTVGSVYGDVHGSDHWDEEDGDRITDEVERFVVRFVDRVGTMAGISTEHLKSLYSLVPSVVTMHTESLEPVYREYKQLAPIRKAKIIRPALLPGEQIQIKGLRCYLIPDGRETGTGSYYGGPCLLPADGAVFLTNYRVIFKGTPVDEFASEMIVTRSFPLGSLTREKKIAPHYLEHLNSWMQECIQLRSATFQMLKLCFDEEVGAEDVEIFRKTIIKLRYPPSVLSTFSFKSTARPPAKCVRLVIPPADKQTTVRSGPKPRVNNAPVKKESSGRHRNLKGSIKRARHRNGLSSPMPARKGTVSSDGSIENLEDGHLDLADIPISITSDSAADIDKVTAMPYCKEYARLGFGTLMQDAPTGPWRITVINLGYAACRSYPAVLVVPRQVSDDSILRVAKNHRQLRFPVATWKNPRNKAVLLRSSAIERSSVAAIIRSGVAASGGSTDAIRSSNVEQDKYLSAIVSATPVSKNRATARQHSLAQNVNMSAATLDMRALDDTTSHRISTVDTIDKAMINRGWEPAAMYVFGDKSNLKNLKKEAYPKIEFVPVEMPDLRDLKNSLKKLIRACCPSSPPKDTAHADTFLKSLQDTEWLSQLSLTMRIAGAVVDLLDIQGSSVLVAFEDGWDTTAQVISLAEVMLDPYYRTIEGFKVLVEKEWLSFGHRFSHRCNHTQATQSSGFAPLLLQFLDGVHQMLCQFPLSFEFNEYFLHFVAYHHVSMRFRTFLLDSDHERHQMGWLADDDSTVVTDKQHRKSKSRGRCLWEYIDELRNKSALFFNFRYSKEHSNKVLRPHCNVSNLKFWSYFVSENVSTGPTFDQELINETETATEEGQQMLEDKYHAIRRCLSGMYGGTVHYDSDECSYQLHEYNRLEEEADRSSSTCWKKVWRKLETPNVKKRPLTLDTMISRHRSAVLHKRDTMDIVLKGKLQIQDYSQTSFTQPHTFEAHSFVTPTNCDFCLQVMWFIGKGAFKCKECGFNCHEKCLSRVPQKCRHYRNLKEQNASVPAVSNRSLPESSGTSKSSRQLCGYLWKKGALFKQWKQRYFILDTERHQLRYYDSEGDIHCQGVLDLSEILSCELSQQNASNDQQVYFDLRTEKRCYNLYAVSQDEAKQWIDRLQSLDT